MSKIKMSLILILHSFNVYAGLPKKLTFVIDPIGNTKTFVLDLIALKAFSLKSCDSKNTGGGFSYSGNEVFLTAQDGTIAY